MRTTIFGSPLRAGVPGLCHLSLLICFTILIGCFWTAARSNACANLTGMKKLSVCALSTNDLFQKHWQEVATFRFRPEQEELVSHQSVTVPVVAIPTPDEIDRALDPLLAGMPL